MERGESFGWDWAVSLVVFLWIPSSPGRPEIEHLLDIPAGQIPRLTAVDMVVSVYYGLADDWPYSHYLLYRNSGIAGHVGALDVETMVGENVRNAFIEAGLCLSIRADECVRANLALYLDVKRRRRWCWS